MLLVDADLLLDKPGLNTERATVFGEAGNRMNRGCLLWPDVIQRSRQFNDTQEVQFFKISTSIKELFYQKCTWLPVACMCVPCFSSFFYFNALCCVL